MVIVLRYLLDSHDGTYVITSWAFGSARETIPKRIGDLFSSMFVRV